MRDSEAPLFPLNTVLFPGRPLVLRVFEPRYLDMVTLCLREGTGFGVVAIQTGQSRTMVCGRLASLAPILNALSVDETE